MNRRIRSALLALPAVLSIAACHASLDVDGPAPHTAGTPPPGFPVDTGDGADGTLEIGGGAAAVNVCAPVLATSGATLLVPDAGSFAEGRRVLLHRVFVIPTAATPAGMPADVDAREAGNFAIARVTTGSQSSLRLDEPVPPWAEGGSQVCTLLELERLVVRTSAALAAPAWDGISGGVLAVLVRDEVVVESGGMIHADAAGFRGGVVGSDGDYGNVTAFEPGALGAAAGRGEGLDVENFGRRGRGVTANGGGGGNSFNSGGGGGGNGGAGGAGARSLNGGAATAGLGGGRVVAPDVRLLFGGGGGAGHQEDSNAGPGGAGGGVVFLVAERLSGAGTLRADGSDGGFSTVFGTNEGDGGGGAGAGGTLAVWVVDAEGFDGVVRASGGSGGGVTLSHPPGGGGGGGRIHSTVSGGVAPGGPPGLRGEDGLPGDAEPGTDGIVSAP